MNILVRAVAFPIFHFETLQFFAKEPHLLIHKPHILVPALHLHFFIICFQVHAQDFDLVAVIAQRTNKYDQLVVEGILQLIIRRLQSLTLQLQI